MNDVEVRKLQKIMVLNGAARKDGNTAALIKAFTKGTESSGNSIREFYLQNMNIHGCLGCNACRKGTADPCVQKDDMFPVYQAFKEADVVVFATPIYFNGITGTLKTVNDRLYAMWSRNDGAALGKKSVLLVTSNMGQIQNAVNWYRQFMDYSGWQNLGIVSGAGSPYGLYKVVDQESAIAAEKLGKSIT